MAERAAKSESGRGHPLSFPDTSLVVDPYRLGRIELKALYDPDLPQRPFPRLRGNLASYIVAMRLCSVLGVLPGGD